MIGKNKLTLNQATMIEALQYWLDATLVKPVRVVGVSWNSSYTQHEIELDTEAPEVPSAP